VGHRGMGVPLAGFAPKGNRPLTRPNQKNMTLHLLLMSCHVMIWMMSRKEVVQIRVSEEEKAAWGIAAGEAAVTVAEWIRENCNEKVRGRLHSPGDVEASHPKAAESKALANSDRLRLMREGKR